MQLSKCKVCGGSIKRVANKYIKCNYCGQIYGMNANIIPEEEIYQEAEKLQSLSTVESNRDAIELFGAIPDFKNSNAKTGECFNNIADIEIREEERRLADERAKEIAERERVENEKKQKEVQKRNRIIIVIVAVIVVIWIIIMSVGESKKSKLYDKAYEYYQNEQYEEALKIYGQIDNYKKSSGYIEEINGILAAKEESYNAAVELYDSGDYQGAIDALLEMTTYSKATEFINQISEELYEKANNKIADKQYKEAEQLLAIIPESAIIYNDVENLLAVIAENITKESYAEAVELYNAGSYEDAQEIFMELGDYQDSKTYLETIGEKIFEQVQACYDAGDYDSVAEKIERIDNAREWSGYEQSIKWNEEVYSAYKGRVKEQACVILKSEGYEELLTYLNNSKNKFFDQTCINQILDEIGPKELVLMTTYDQSRNFECGNVIEYMDSDWNYTDMPFTDNWGNIYKSGGYCSGTATFGSTKQFVEYDVREYSYFTANIIMNYIHRSWDDGGYVRIYGDDALLYTSKHITKGYQTEKLALDISNVTILRIEFDEVASSVVDPMLYELK